jgi:hypothetical protein
MTDKSNGKSLKLTIPMGLALGTKVELGSRFTFEITLSGRNLSQCELFIESDNNIFAEGAQNLSLELVEPNQNVAISLSPIALTEKPAYISIKAISDNLAQAAGFFVQVVASQN